MVLQDFVLVLDDFHRIESPPVLSMIGFLLDHLPPQLHLFISSETDPPWSLAALRSAEQLTEIRTPYLAFTLDEVSSFFNDVLQLKLAYGEISALITRTEAVPGRIQYAGLCLQQTGQPATDFISAFEGDERDSLSFLVENLLKTQSPEMIGFLRKICILEYLNAPLCTLLTGDAANGEKLQQLAEKGLFLSSLDVEKQWYGFHPFVKALLRKQLSETGAENWPELHRQAGHWFAQSGWRRLAFRHAIAATDYDSAAQIIEQNAQEMLQNGELVTVESWLAALPDQVIQSRPMISVCRAWVLIIAQRFDEVEQSLQSALGALDNATSPDEIIGHVNAIREFLAGKGLS
jgi:LuxR family maltose regulon positive regulatory protein